MVKRVLSFLLAFVFIIFCTSTNAFGLTPQQRKAQLEKQLQSTETKLKELGVEQKDTKEYLNVLDEKLKYLREQYNLEKSELEDISSRVTNLEKQIDSNKKAISSISNNINELNDRLDTLNNKFSSTYEAYCKRIRALYMCNQGQSVLSLLLCSKDISSFVARLEMVAIVSKMDGNLLQRVQSETNDIMSTMDELNSKKAELNSNQARLKSSTKELKIQKAKLQDEKQMLEDKKASITEQQQEANTVLQALNDASQEYGELHDATEEELAEIDAEIEKADKKYHNQKTTTKKNNNATTIKESRYISLCYPCPSYTKVTCGFKDYSGHTGCDFSTKGDTNQKIVASESGTVIISTDLKNKNGSYRSYGRYIVIRHDKTTKAGKTVYTLYAHNNKRVVKAGEYVKKGQLIAYSGSTGNSTGPHCHFEVRIGSSGQKYAQDPEKYLP